MDDASNLAAHYDPYGRQEVRIQELLDDLKDEVTDV
jgi:hypothetical protein